MHTARRDPPHTGSPRRAGILVALLITNLLPMPAEAQVLRDEFWVPDGYVRDLAVTNGAVYLGGDFTQVGPPIGGFVGLDPASGATQQPFPKVGGIVRTVVSDGADGWYIGGTFVSVRGLPRANLAHLDAAGNVTDWNPGTNFDVLTLARDATTGMVYVGGHFTTVGGASRAGIAAVDSNGVVGAWNAGIALGSVHALVLSGSTLYAGGSFTSVAGQTRRGAVALDAATGAVGAWNPDVDAVVRAMAVQVSIGFPVTTVVYLGGTFASVGGQPRARLAAVDGVTGGLAAWNPGANGPVNAIALAGGFNPITNPLRIYVGGEFTVVGGTPRNRLAQLTEGGGVASWNPDASERVHALRVAGSLLYVGGEFTSIGGQPLRHAAAIDRTTGAATNWDPRLGGFVRVLSATGTSVFAGGDFFTAGGVPRRNLAALDRTTGQPTAWDPGADATVEALETDGATIYTGGSFTQVGGQPRARIAAVDAATGAATPWNPGASATVYELAMGAGVVYTAGNFTTIGGQPRARLAALDLASGLPTPWNPGASSTALAMVVSEPWVYIGGSFTSVGGQTRVSIARVDATTGALSAWNPNPGNFAAIVFALAVSGPNVYVGGGFSQMGGRPRDNLAVVDAAAGAALPWDPYADGTVLALATDASSVYAGGSFYQLGGERRLGFGALDTGTGLVQPWDPGIPGSTRTLKLHEGMFFAAGSSIRYQSPHGSFAVFTAGTTDVASGPVRAPAAGIRAFPNPSRADVVLRFALPRRGEADVAIHDLAGRAVRRLARGVRNAGPQEIAWDGRDESGERVGAGVYFARVTAGAERMVAKVLRVK